ncbi:polysaccharide biosynthesis/export family protein [Chelativorans sp. YIM 93263]|uniref:polysaccharide biosynthesis/export family protein n=1 Tax=Chelativorans sp. YIM 93263 TaxID=2906648 RepID=UPI002379D56C|nr:polysaccharide biosynthesis/export family protein [Chelativorans sp. YIM 93263]
MGKPFQFAVGVMALALLAGCTGYRPPPPAFHEALYQPYLIGAGDQLRITVLGQGELTNSYSVDQSGNVAFPIVGSVPARGRTAAQIEKTIAQKLRGGYLRDPDVTVEVAQYRPIFVMGEVGEPGQYSFVPGMTVQKAIAVGGGFTPRAEQANVDVTREINGEVMTGRVFISDPLMPGDTIYVRERLF